MSSANYPNAPNPIDHASVAKFRSIADAHGGLAKSNRFVVRLILTGELVQAIDTTQLSNDLEYLTELAEIPGRGFQNVDLRYYGPSFKLPFQTSYEDLNLGFICRARGAEREFFDDWMQVINPSNTWDFNYRQDYYADIQIFHLTDTETQYTGGGNAGSGGSVGQNNCIYKVTCRNAYPIIVNQQPLLWQDDQFMKLTVGFTYSHTFREGLDPITNTPVPNQGRLVAGIDSSVNPALGVRS